MNSKEGNINFFDNLKGMIKKSFGNIFNTFGNDLTCEQNSREKEQKTEKKLDQKVDESLEQRIENKVNKIIILEELSELRKNIKIVEGKLTETLDLDIDENEKEKIILTLKDEAEELATIYCRSLQPNLSIINDDIEFDKLQIEKLLKNCDEQLLKINKYKKIKEETDQEIIHNIINENIKEQTKDIEQLRDNVKRVETKEKRANLIIEIHNFLNKTIDTGINLITLPNNKNQSLEVLINVIVLNNRLRNLRKIMRKENSKIEFIRYKDIVDSIKQDELTNSKTEELINDTLFQFKTLKQEFEMEFYYDMDRYSETNEIMIDFSSIEYEITSKRIELEELLNK